MKKVYCLILMIILTISCANKNNNINPEVKSFLNSKIIKTNDLDREIKNYYPDKDYILLLYLKTEDCAPCVLEKVNMLNAYISDFEKFKTGVLLMIQEGEKNEEISLIVDDLEIDYPIVFDKDNKFIESNKPIQNKICQTFIMDKEYKVIWIGSPIQNKETLTRYYKMMNLLMQ